MEVGLQCMWQKLKNLLASFSTYADLSPDLRQRRQVNRFLRDRPALTPDEWFEQFWEPLEISQAVTDFVYLSLQNYSGLEWARVQPSDHLVKDLHLVLVCWFDWEISFCEDFFCCFGVELGLEVDNFQTVEDLVIFLDHQLLSVNHS